MLCRLFTQEVFSLLLRKKLINLTLVQKILRWRHTGFNVHSQVRTKTREEAERVGKYMIRPILSLKKLSFDEREGQVTISMVKTAQSLSGWIMWNSCPESPLISLIKDRS